MKWRALKVKPPHGELCLLAGPARCEIGISQLSHGCADWRWLCREGAAPLGMAGLTHWMLLSKVKGWGEASAGALVVHFIDGDGVMHSAAVPELPKAKRLSRAAIH